MATQIPSLTTISAFPDRTLPQQSFDAAVRTNMSQLSNMVSELNSDFIPNVNSIATDVESQSTTATTKASEAAASALTSASNSQMAIASAFFGNDLGGLACRDITTQKTVRHQIMTATLYNRGVVYGAELAKSNSVTRTITCTTGRLFANGRTYELAASSVTVPTNASTASKTAYIYATLASSTLTLSITALSGSIPNGGIELGTIIVASQDTSDTYLSRSTLSDTSRREPSWPQVQLTPAYKYVALNNNLINNNYQVSIEVLSASSMHQLGHVYAANKLTNGFQVLTDGCADAISVRTLVQFFDM